MSNQGFILLTIIFLLKSVTPLFSQDEEIWIEAECASLGDSWKIGFSDLSSNGLFVNAVDGISISESPTINSNNWIRADFAVKSDGLYRLWLRVKGKTETTTSLWFSLDGEEWIQWKNFLITKDWKWLRILNASESDKALSYILNPGEFSLYVALTSDQIEIDKILLTNIAQEPEDLGGSDFACNALTEIEEMGSFYPSLKIFPNPVHALIHVTSDQSFDKLSVLNTSGIRLYHWNIAPGQKVIQFPIDLPPGIYFLTAHYGLKRQIVKFIVD